MSLKFAIIPINSSFTNVAYDIKSKIKNIGKEVFVYIDTNYDLSFTSRIQKRKKDNFNIITIDEDFNETKSIVVKYCEKGSRSHSYEVDEFIDLISSFDNEDEGTDTDDNDAEGREDKNKDTDEDTTNNNNDCVIM